MILGVDPGRDKTGWALVLYSGELVLSGICPTGEFEEFGKTWRRSCREWETALAPWICERCLSVVRPQDVGFAVDYVALGNGTGSKGFFSVLEHLGLKAVLIDERGTTLMAREFYWRLHRPSFWQKCLPRTLRIPPRAVDDMAAWAIALRSIVVSPADRSPEN